MKKHPTACLQRILLLACLSAAQVMAAQSFSPGFLKLEVYRDVPGITVDDLRADPKYPDSPDEVHFLTRFEIPPSKYVAGNGGGIAVGQKVSGYIVPTQTASYVFYMSANQAGELWLAKDPADPATLELIATGTANYPARTYDINNPSAAIQLEAGKRYYVEALMKEGGKEDSMAVAWTKENEPPPPFLAAPIGGQFLGILTDADSTPPPAVSDLAVDANTKGVSYLWLNWTAPSDPGHTNAAAYYDLRYSPQPITAANWANATPAETVFFFPSPGGTAETFKVANLSPGVTYYFAVRARDLAGNLAAISNVAQGQTKAAVAGDFEVLWSLEFNNPGEDPTAKGDWKHRTPGQTAFNPATQVAGGVLKCKSFNPLLDTTPKNNFTEDFIVETRMVCLTPVTADKMFDGAVFWVNMNAHDGQLTPTSISLQLMADGTQRLNVVNNSTILTNYTGLSTNFQTIRLEYEPVFSRLRLSINGADKGYINYDKSTANDDRYATILSWGADAEFDYVRIGRPARPINARWDVNFDKPGIDPTAKGDWRHRNSAQTTFDPATQVADGLLKCLTWNPILDTAPKDDFNYPFIIETRLRCVDALPDNTKMYEGACFFINMDALNGQIAKSAFSLQLLPDGTQQLNFMNSDRIITNYTGLLPGFHTVRWEVNPAQKQFAAYIDGSYAGTLAYERATASDDRYATILGWGYAAEFDYVQIGTLIAPAAPQMQISKTTSGLAISWPTAASGFTLEKTTGLSPAAWSKAGDPTVQGDQNVFTTTAGGPTQFYRLKQ